MNGAMAAREITAEEQETLVRQVRRAYHSVHILWFAAGG